MKRLLSSGLLFVAFTAAGAGIFTTVRPVVVERHVGGCSWEVSRVWQPGSILWFFAASSGQTKIVMPDTKSAEYGCAVTVESRVLPVDLYSLAILTAIGGWMLRPRRRHY